MGGLSEVESIFESVYDLWMDDAQAYLDWADFYHRHVDDGRSVLELACGTGNMTQLIAPSTKHYVASDLSQAMLKQAQQKVQRPASNGCIRKQTVPLKPILKLPFCSCNSSYHRSNQTNPCKGSQVPDYWLSENHEIGYFIQHLSQLTYVIVVQQTSCIV